MYIIDHISRQMEIHIIISILLDYHGTIKEWSVGRCLNKNVKHIIDSKKYNKEAFGKRTFIQTNQCSICNKNAQPPEFDMLNYKHFEMAYHIVHCRHWQCRMSAVYSMIGHYASRNMYILRQPFQKSNKVNIPRTDGSETRGKCINNTVLKINNKYYIYTYWHDENGEHYNKLVPFKYYTAAPIRVY